MSLAEPLIEAGAATQTDEKRKIATGSDLSRLSRRPCV